MQRVGNMKYVFEGAAVGNRVELAHQTLRQFVLVQIEDVNPPLRSLKYLSNACSAEKPNLEKYARGSTPLSRAMTPSVETAPENFARFASLESKGSSAVIIPIAFLVRPPKEKSACWQMAFEHPGEGAGALSGVECAPLKRAHTPGHSQAGPVPLGWPQSGAYCIRER
jgi:hypothetical protein